MKTILVTGATGNVGREVVREILRLGHGARAAVLERDLVDVEGAPAVHFNFRSPAEWPAVLAGVDSLFLMRPPEMADVDATLVPFLQAARTAGVRHISFLSLIGVDKNKRIPHYAVEQALRASGIAFTFVRPGFFMQNATGAYRDDIRFRDQIIVPAGRGKLAFIDVRDIGAVAAKTLCEQGHAGAIYSITGARALNFFELAEVIGAAVGRPIRYTNPSSETFRIHQLSTGAAADYVEVMQGIYFPVRLGVAGGVTDDFSRLMGRPPITIEQYAADYAAHWSLPSPEERAAHAARLAAVPPVARRSLWQRLAGRFGGGNTGMGRIGA